jgi:hypothetical protein
MQTKTKGCKSRKIAEKLCPAVTPFLGDRICLWHAVSFFYAYKATVKSGLLQQTFYALNTCISVLILRCNSWVSLLFLDLWWRK